jgi:hypothetical protein
MRNKNLMLLGLLFVSSILLAGVTIAASNAILEMGNSNTDSMEKYLDADPSVLNINEMEEAETIEITYEGSESFIDEGLLASGESRLSSFASYSEFYGFVENHTYTPRYTYTKDSYQSPSGTMSSNTSSGISAITVADSNSNGVSPDSILNVELESISDNDFSSTNSG